MYPGVFGMVAQPCRVSDLQPNCCGFVLPVRGCGSVMTMSKLFKPVCLCYQAV